MGRVGGGSPTLVSKLRTSPVTTDLKLCLKAKKHPWDRTVAVTISLGQDWGGSPGSHLQASEEELLQSGLQRKVDCRI